MPPHLATSPARARHGKRGQAQPKRRRPAKNTSRIFLNSPVRQSLGSGRNALALWTQTRRAVRGVLAAIPAPDPLAERPGGRAGGERGCRQWECCRQTYREVCRVSPPPTARLPTWPGIMRVEPAGSVSSSLQEGIHGIPCHPSAFTQPGIMAVESMSPDPCPMAPVQAGSPSRVRINIRDFVPRPWPRRGRDPPARTGPEPVASRIPCPGSARSPSLAGPGRRADWSQHRC